MADYNLTGLSTRSFEQLVQAIALKVIGSGVVIYGDGPDGGREATFEGRANYPSEGDPWNGYIVIQAKFKQRPQDTQKDGEWALEQLEKELEDFANPKKGRRNPGYYIFATNIVLTPVQDKGTKDKVNKLFEKFKDSVPLKGYDIWDYDKIRVFLDNSEDIRHSYAAWITPGDVFAQIIKTIQPNQADFETVISNFIKKELLADQYANLEQAGHSKEECIPLAHVFTDLPFSATRQAEPQAESQTSKGIVATLVEKSKDKFNPNSLNCIKEDNKHEPGRFVVIGGPGQGKTTVSQFICQLFRAAILVTKGNLGSEIRTSLEIFQDQCQKEGIELPTARRFPIRIVLNEFATALASEQTPSVNSLLSYIAERIRKKTDTNISVNDLRQWLSSYPWLIILDGLDEVPASSNRSEVLAAIRNFWIDAEDVDADIMVVATTRPQGYNSDFSTSIYEHIWLSPLSTEKAIHYASRLTEKRYAGDLDRQEKILKRLDRATRNEATNRLMQSPLQVTIMTLLVDKVGQPPQERWKLFNKYYEVIYDRELERDIPASEILVEYRDHIDIIHQRVGLLLQIESERSGKTDARLSCERFAKIVDNRLQEVGCSPEETEKLKDKIIKAAAERLVFLVGLESNKVGFEIRSLQEFMASKALMSGTDEQIRKRIEKIADVINWRNVFLFAVGKCVSDRDYLIDQIYAICANLNEFNDTYHFTLVGSRLALDILEDGPIRKRPNFLKSFTRLALYLLDLAPNDFHLRLADIYTPELQSIYSEEIYKRLENRNQQLGAWLCIIRLINRGIEWAKELGDKYWSTIENTQLEIIYLYSRINNIFDEDVDDWIFSKIESVFIRQSPLSITHKLDYFSFECINSNFKCPDSVQRFWVLFDEAIEDTDVYNYTSLTFSDISNEISLEISFYPIDSTDDDLLVYLSSCSNLHSDWIPYIATAKFLQNPSKLLLAEALRVIAQNYKTENLRWMTYRFPWVITACLRASKNQGELLDIASRVEAGELGDIDDWLKAEERWMTIGILEQDLYSFSDESLLFDKNIAKQGFPFNIIHSVFYSYSNESLEESLPTLTKLCDVCSNINSSVMLGRIYEWIFLLFPTKNIKDYVLQLSQESKILNCLKNIIKYDLVQGCFPLFLNDIELIYNLYGENQEGIDLVNILGLKTSHIKDSSEFYKSVLPFTDTMIHSFCLNPNLVGILRILSFLNFTQIPTLQKQLSIIPTNLLELERFDSPRLKEAALIVSLARPQWFPEDVKPLVQFAVEVIDSHPRAMESLVNAIKEAIIPADIAELMLIEIYKQLPKALWEYFSDVIGAMDNLLASRISRLAEPSIWSELCLPSGLINIVSQS